MRNLLSSLAMLAALPALSGCVAALIPLAAAGALGKGELDRAKARKQIIVAGAVSVEDQAALPPHAPATPATNAGRAGPLGKTTKSDGFSQGKKIAVAPEELGAGTRAYLARIYRAMRPSDRAPYDDFAKFALKQAGYLKGSDGKNAGNRKLRSPESAVLVPRVDIIKPQRVSCAGKPLAVIIDLDTPDMDAWSRSETLYRQDGLAEALQRLRADDITVIWLSDLSADSAPEIATILKDAGIAGQKENDDFLFLNRGRKDRKQARRWDAARSYCILAAAGDTRSDFDELYDYLRNPDGAITLENMFGAGWFIAPPPLVVPPADDGPIANIPLPDEG